MNTLAALLNHGDEFVAALPASSFSDSVRAMIDADLRVAPPTHHEYRQAVVSLLPFLKRVSQS